MSSPLVHNLYKGLKLGVFTHDDKRCMFTLVFCSHNPAYVHTIRSFKLKGNEADFIFLCSQLFWFVLYLTQIFFPPYISEPQNSKGERSVRHFMWRTISPVVAEVGCTFPCKFHKKPVELLHLTYVYQPVPQFLFLIHWNPTHELIFAGQFSHVCNTCTTFSGRTFRIQLNVSSYLFTRRSH